MIWSMIRTLTLNINFCYLHQYDRKLKGLGAILGGWGEDCIPFSFSFPLNHYSLKHVITWQYNEQGKHGFKEKRKKKLEQVTRLEKETKHFYIQDVMKCYFSNRGN